MGWGEKECEVLTNLGKADRRWQRVCFRGPEQTYDENDVAPRVVNAICKKPAHALQWKQQSRMELSA